MKPIELETVLENNKNIDWSYDDEDDAFYFRNSNLDYYINNPDAFTKIDGWKMRELNPEELIPTINKGLELEKITRVTGYMSKVSGWNPGKVGELKDRHKDNHLGAIKVEGK